jgi:hypothetical protein
VEDHPLDRDLGVEDLDEVPGDRLALAVLVGGEVDLAGFLGEALQLLDVVAPVGGEDVDGLESGVDVDAELGPILVLVLRRDLLGRARQVPDVAHRGLHHHVISEILGDLLRLGRRLDDDQCLTHASAVTVTQARPEE